MCEFIEWFGWYELTTQQQWSFSLKIVGVLGGLVLFWWTVGQWFLTRKIEFEKSILSGINKRHKGWVKENARLESDNLNNRHDTQIATNELIIQSLLLDEVAVRKTAMGFKELRYLSKKYMGTPHPDMEELWNSDELKEQVLKIRELARKQ